ncbi:MAG TPA: hypothetical protein VMT20_27345 [Terriglobia bacterium]|nr:hypothetical protein [Terriglobia bacterium]
MKGTSIRIGQLGLIVLATAALAAADTTNMPPPGTLNYVEGQVYAQGQKQSPKSVGTTYLEPNQVLDTRSGNAELLLTPGVYMRIGHDSAVKMISPGLADTQIQLTGGSGIVEVDELFKENDVSVVLDGATTRLEKVGLYDFNAGQPSVKVLDGKAVTYEGDQKATLKKGHEALMAEGQPLVQKKFNDTQVEEDPLYRWSKLRSEYATESNVDAGNALMADGGWWGPGWYWDPFCADFAFMPGWGMGWGAFGYPFFSPWCVGWAPYYGFGGYGGFYHYPVTHPIARGGTGRAAPPLAHQPNVGARGFRALPRTMASGRMGMPAGGFRGGMVGGGFRGGMVGGGFHSGGLGGFHGGFAGRR